MITEPPGKGSPPSLDVLVWSLARLWLAGFFLLWSLALELPWDTTRTSHLQWTPYQAPISFLWSLMLWGCAWSWTAPETPRLSSGSQKPHPQGTGRQPLCHPLSLSSTSVLAREIKGSPSRTLSVDQPPLPTVSPLAPNHTLAYSASHSWAGKGTIPKGGSAISQ